MQCISCATHKYLSRATKSGWIQMHLSFIVMRRLALRNRSHASSRMPWSRVPAAIRSGRAYRFISRFFIAPLTTPLTLLVYDSDADAAARQIKRSSLTSVAAARICCFARSRAGNFTSLSPTLFGNIWSKYRELARNIVALGQCRRHSWHFWKSSAILHTFFFSSSSPNIFDARCNKRARYSQRILSAIVYIGSSLSRSANEGARFATHRTFRNPPIRVCMHKIATIIYTYT